MAAHTYWRIYITANAGSAQYTSLAELRFFYTENGVSTERETIGGTASASSTNGVTYNADKGFDKSEGSYWSTALYGHAPCWLCYQFGSAVTVNAVLLRASNIAGNITQSPAAFTLQSSDNGSSWADEASWSGATWSSPSESKTFGGHYPSSHLRNAKSYVQGAAAQASSLRVTGLLYTRDMLYGGNYRINGTVTELGLAGRYPVRLFDRVSGFMVRQQWSESDGSYSFTNIVYKDGGYFLVAHDYGLNPLNAAIADYVTPELMP